VTPQDHSRDQRSPLDVDPQLFPRRDCSSFAWVVASFSVGLNPWDMRPLHHTRQSHSGLSDVDDCASWISILMTGVLSLVSRSGV
jgi:hypothetical protein